MVFNTRPQGFPSDLYLYVWYELLFMVPFKNEHLELVVDCYLNDVDMEIAALSFFWGTECWITED
jgi:hypothetical protein